MSARRIWVSMGLAAMSGLALAQVNSDDGTLPLQASRTIEFSAEEGTWVSLDVTPDGRSIVFDLLGDLYRLPIEGGAARRITQGMAYDAQPRVSPDGRSIAFISDRSGEEQLWVARIDGSEPRMLSNKQRMMSPAWTPDSRAIVVSMRSQLMLYPIEGGSGVPLDLKNFPRNPYDPMVAEQTITLGPVMSPDGRFLYFASIVGSNTRYTKADWQIHRRDMHSGEVTVLTARLGGAFRPVIAPDGKRLVYATRYEAGTGLRVLDLESREDRWLIYPVQTDNTQSQNESSADVFPGYAFLPDGTAIVLASEGKIRRVALDSGRATIIPFRAHVSLQIGPDLSVPHRLDEGPVRVRLIQNPRLSPDGRRLVFSALTHLYVQDLPAGRPRRLTQGDTGEFQPVWSPDGRWIAYVSWGPQGGHVWKMSADGRGKPQRLTAHPAYYSEIAFSPDGARIVGIRGSAQERLQHHEDDNIVWVEPLELVWLPAAGGEVGFVASAADLRAPHFTADPQRIYFNTLEGSLSSMRFDGSDRRIHLRLDSNLSVPKPSRMHPQGRWALAKLADQVYVIAVPPGDGAAVDVRTPTVPVKRLTDTGADYFAWSNDGKSITWAMGSTFYSRALDSIDWSVQTPKNAVPTRRAEDDAAVTAVQVRLEFPRAKPAGTLVLRHATALTMKGQEMIRDADIVVKDNRIAAIGPAGQVSLPPGARAVDVSGKFILPGFIDAHTHWTLKSQDVLQPDDWIPKANLAYGVTSGREVLSRQDFFAYQDMLEAGLMTGPRLFPFGLAVRGVRADFKSLEQTRAYLRRYSDHYRTRYIMGFTLGDRRQRQWVLMAAKELGLMPTLEGSSEAPFTHLIDGFAGQEYALGVTPFYQDAVELFARSGTAYTPVLQVLYDDPDTLDYFFASENPHDDPKVKRFILHRQLDFLSRRRAGWARPDEYRFPEAAMQAARIQRAGGLVGVAGHGALQGLSYHWEMWALATAMKPQEVLQAATIDGARILGLAQDLGSLESGKLADMVVLDKNPLQDIRNTNTVRYVMKNGELYEGDTLRQIWPRERPMSLLQFTDSPLPSR